MNPLGKQHIKLSFLSEINISQVKAEGQYEEIELYYTRINEKLRYDDHKIFDFVRSEGDSFSVAKEENVTSLLISAEFLQGKDRTITITLTK